ncbi:FHA domain-containing protein [Microbacterium panaciterrae]|uniref:FHA domain-containing protein n=1 Tax=Microbacterium panaciterrae TaxID=985759 RepID=A0ABP8P5C8_9MICO
MNTAYRAGSWYLLIGPRAVVALPPDAEFDLVAQLWARVGSDEVAFSDVVDALTAAGRGSFSAIPPFAAIVREGADARIAVRGQVTARVVGAGAEHEITGAEVTTWSERFVPSVAGAEIVVEDARDDTALPIVAGIVRAARVGFGSVLDPVLDPAPVPEPAVPELSVPEPEPSVPEPVEGPAPAPDPAPIAPAVEVPAPDADVPLMAVPAPPFDDDVDDTVLSPSSPNAVPVETILPPADTIGPPLGGHTLDLRPVGGAEQEANEVYDEAEDGDHDGATISLAQARALRGSAPSAPDPIPAAAVPATPAADSSTGPRIRMSTGQVVALDRTVVIGRRPRATRSSGATLPHLIAVDSPEQDISRSHLEIRPESDAVVVLDLHTTNGSTLLRQGADPVRLHPGEQTIVVTGDVIDLGDGVTVAFEDLP